MLLLLMKLNSILAENILAEINCEFCQGAWAAGASGVVPAAAAVAVRAPIFKIAITPPGTRLHITEAPPTMTDH